MADYLAARWDDAVQARYWSKVDRAGPADCWKWEGSLTPKGYGTFSIDNRHYAAHRLLVVKQNGSALEGLVCDHLCRERTCVNPAHIEPVTNRENIARGDAADLIRERAAAVTHCPRGHEYTPSNTRVSSNNKRHCRECGHELDARRREERRARHALALSKGSEG